MAHLNARLVGVELYFDNLEVAKAFYQETLGLPLEEYAADHHAKFAAGDAFACTEKRGVEDYASADKAVLFLEVPSVRQAVERVGPPHVVRAEVSGPKPWAAVRDPEGHTVLLLERDA